MVTTTSGAAGATPDTPASSAAARGATVAGAAATAAEPGTVATPRRAPHPPARRVASFTRRHAVFGALAALGLAGRVLVVVAYQPALIYMGDSAAYLEQASERLWPGDWRPSGYPMFLRLVDGHEHLMRLVVVQHLLTFATAVALYAVTLQALRRQDGTARGPKAARSWRSRAAGGLGSGVARGPKAARSWRSRAAGGPGSGATERNWVAALATAPALLSPWVLDLGQFVLAESLFASLVGAGVVLFARPGPPGLPTCLVGGLLLGTAVVVRPVGYGPLAVAGLLLVATAFRALRIRRRTLQQTTLPPQPRRRRLGHGFGAFAAFAAFAAAAAAPQLAYSAWSAANGERFSVSAHSGFFLYGRLAPFADCAVLSRPELRSLCDPRPVADRPQPDVYLWSDDAPLRSGNDDVPPGREDLAGQFAGEVLRAQPWMVIRTTGGYLAGYFSPVLHENAKTSRAATWELPDEGTNILPAKDPHHFDGYYVVRELNHGLAPVLAGYSKAVYAPMPLVGAGLAAGLAATAAGWRRGRPGPPGLFWLAGGAGMSVLAIGALTAGFEYRYLASVIALLGVASVVGAASLARAVRTPRGG